MTAIPTAAVLPVSTSQPSLHRAVGVLLGLTVLVDAAFLIGLSAPDWRDSAAVNVGVSLASQWVPVAVFWLVAVATRFRRLPVVLATAGVTLSALGDSYYTLAMDADGYLPSPSPADVGYVLFYPLLLAALLALVPRGPRRVAVSCSSRPPSRPSAPPRCSHSCSAR